MNESLRLFRVLPTFGIGPVVAFLSLLQAGCSTFAVARLPGCGGYLPALLIPVEWVLPPVLIFLGVGELEASWMPLRIVGLVVCLAGAVFLVWAAVWLGRFSSMMRPSSKDTSWSRADLIGSAATPSTRA